MRRRAVALPERPRKRKWCSTRPHRRRRSRFRPMRSSTRSDQERRRIGQASSCCAASYAAHRAQLLQAQRGWRHRGPTCGPQGRAELEKRCRRPCVNWAQAAGRASPPELLAWPRCSRKNATPQQGLLPARPTSTAGQGQAHKHMSSAPGLALSSANHGVLWARSVWRHTPRRSPSARTGPGGNASPAIDGQGHRRPRLPRSQSSTLHRAAHPRCTKPDAPTRNARPDNASGAARPSEPDRPSQERLRSRAQLPARHQGRCPQSPPRRHRRQLSPLASPGARAWMLLPSPNCWSHSDRALFFAPLSPTTFLSDD